MKANACAPSSSTNDNFMLGIAKKTIDTVGGITVAMDGPQQHLKEATNVAAMRIGGKTLFNVNDLSDDFDQDGAVSADEKYVANSLKALSGENGEICARQLYLLLLQYAAARRSYRLVRWFALLLLL